MGLSRRDSFILSGGTIVTMSDRRDVIRDGAVAVDDGVIVDVGPSSELIARHPGFRTDRCDGSIVMPGLVNLHVHAALASTRGTGDDAGVTPIYSKDVPQGVFLDEDDLYWFTLLGAIQAIRLGSTSIVENYAHTLNNTEAIARTGIRAWVSERLHDADLELLTDGMYHYDDRIGRRHLKATEQIIERWHGHDRGRITCQVGPHGPDTASADLLRQAAGLARAHGLELFMHVSQSEREEAQVRKIAGVSSVQYLKQLGILGPELIAGHCRHADYGDADDLAASRTNICHMPLVNAKAGYIAPIPGLRARRANIGIGTDNMLPDMIGAVRGAVLLNRVAASSPTVIRAYDALSMATVNGARALHSSGAIGTLERGKRADIIVVDAGALHLAPITDPVANLVFCGQGTDVSDVVVDGRYVMRNREILSVDAQEVLRETQRRADALWQARAQR